MAAPVLLGLGTLLAALVARNRRASGTPSTGTLQEQQQTAMAQALGGDQYEPPGDMLTAPAKSLTPPPPGVEEVGLGNFGLSPPKLLGASFNTTPGVYDWKDEGLGYTDNYVQKNMYGNW
jgi:hypothetical protein